LDVPDVAAGGSGTEVVVVVVEVVVVIVVVVVVVVVSTAALSGPLTPETDLLSFRLLVACFAVGGETVAGGTASGRVSEAAVSSNFLFLGVCLVLSLSFAAIPLALEEFPKRPA
jgi:hypothetical protein